MGFVSKFKKRFPNFITAVVATEVWETFSYYSLNWILTNYLSSELGMDTTFVYAIPSLNGLISNILPLIYGYLADRALGFRIMVFNGIIMLFLAHFLISFSGLFEYTLYIGMAFLTIGAGLFKGNHPNLLGACYDRYPQFPRIAGFTLFYTGINFGGFVSALTSAIFSYYVSYHFAFSLGAIGMVVAMGVFFYYRKLFDPIDYIRNPDLFKRQFYGFLTWPRLFMFCNFLLVIPVTFVFAYAYVVAEINFLVYFAIFVALLCILVFFLMKTARDKKNFVLLLFYFMFYMFFTAFAGQVLTTFPLFLTRNTYNYIFGVEIPPLMVNVTNPGLIMIAGLIISFFREPGFKEEILRVFLALISTSGSFLIFYWGAIYADEETGLTSLAWPFIGTLVISSGEVLIGPLMRGICTKYSPIGKKGIVMGIHMATMGFSSLTGFIFAGIFDIPLREDNSVDPLVSIQVYKEGFINIVIYNLVACAIFLVCIPFMYLLYRPTKEELEAKSAHKLDKANFNTEAVQNYKLQESSA